MYIFIFIQPGGSLFITTPNRTFCSWLGVVQLGEKLNFVPKGTHEWEKFICPHELQSILEINCKYKITLMVIPTTLFHTNVCLNLNLMYIQMC